MNETIKTLVNLKQKLQTTEQQINKLVANSIEVQTYLRLLKDQEQTSFGVSEWTKTAAQEVPEENWTPTKGKQDEFAKGELVLIRKRRETRVVNSKLFVEKYPLLTNLMVDDGRIKVPVTVIERELSKDDLEEIIYRDVAYSYDMRLIEDGRTRIEEQIRTDEQSDRLPSKRRIARSDGSKRKTKQRSTTKRKVDTISKPIKTKIRKPA
jgi:hypothetical protein